MLELYGKNFQMQCKNIHLVVGFDATKPSILCGFVYANRKCTVIVFFVILISEYNTVRYFPTIWIEMMERLLWRRGETCGWCSESLRSIASIDLIITICVVCEMVRIIYFANIYVTWKWNRSHVYVVKYVFLLLLIVHPSITQYRTWRVEKFSGFPRLYIYNIIYIIYIYVYKTLNTYGRYILKFLLRTFHAKYLLYFKREMKRTPRSSRKQKDDSSPETTRALAYN